MKPGWSYRPAITRLTTLATTAVTAYLLQWGWRHRADHYFTPQEGLGYALGIVGASLMLLLALYPARKHWRAMRALGATRHWFRMHMLFGILGPAAILFHCNFSTGATNSNVALFSMLIVASSGLVGRYLYAHIHEGLYGRHLELKDVGQEWLRARERMKQSHHLDAIAAQVAAFEAPLAQLRRTLGSSVWNLALAGWRRTMLRYGAEHALKKAALPAQERADALALLAQRLDAASAVYRYNAFERLFSLWHLLHLPLFVMLIVTGIVHVFAVNLY